MVKTMKLSCYAIFMGALQDWHGKYLPSEKLIGFYPGKTGKKVEVFLGKYWEKPPDRQNSHK